MTTTVILNAEQEEIRAVSRGFLEARFPSDRVRELMASPDGFDQSSWEEIAGLGWCGIAVPEELGGAGYTIVERCLLLEEMGRVLYPGPYLSSAVFASDAVTAAGEGEEAEEILSAVASGSVRAALVAGGDLLGSGDPAGDVHAVGAGAELRLSGNGGLTVDGLGAQLLLVAAALEDGDVGLFAVDPAAAGVGRHPAATIDETRRTAVVEFDSSPARRLDAGGETAGKLANVFDRAAISVAAEAVGGARRAIEMTVDYLLEREQFGRPIGNFQALKHRVADLHVKIDGAREAVYGAADAVLDGGDPERASMAAATAKRASAEGYVCTTAEAVQLHGGIGFTEEHDIGLHYKRALVGEQMLGSALSHLERIAVGLGV